MWLFSVVNMNLSLLPVVVEFWRQV